MKKITLLFALVFISSISSFATRYLVQLGTPGAATWRTAGTGETLVDLTVAGQSFNVWYNATVRADDETWIAAGKYVFTVSEAKVNFNPQLVYGGFAGTEIAIGERAKNGTNPWNFANASILDGDAKFQILKAGVARAGATFDGLTLQNSKLAAAEYRDGMTVQNCIIQNNTSTSDGGGVKFYQGGSLKNSYIVGNKATYGAGFASNNTSTAIALVSGCLFENNSITATTGGAGIRIQGTGITNISDCVLRGNKSTNALGTVLQNGGAIATTSATSNFSNCLVYNNAGSNAVHATAGNFTNITIANNQGGFYVAAAGAINLTNTVLWGNKTLDKDGNPVDTGIFGFLDNTNCVINNSAFSPALDPANYTQDANIALQADNDSQDNAKGPGFVAQTSFYGLPISAEDITEVETADWSLKSTSGLIDLGKTVADLTTDIAGTLRPQGSAYDIGAYEYLAAVAVNFNTTVTFNEGGTVNDLTSGAVLSNPEGTVIAFTITPNAGMKITSVLYNDVEVKGDVVEGVYTAAALIADATLVVQFDISTGLETQKSAFTCFSMGHSVEVRGLEANQVVELYSISGARMAVQKSENSAATFTAQKGIYLVKVSDKVVKVVVD